MKKVFIIGEAGVNHNGNIDIAYKLIDEAVNAGVDAVKFQTAVPELVMTPDAKKAKYQEEITGKNESQLDMAKKIHLPLSAYKKLKDYCDKKDILFLSTPFDLVTIDTLEELNMPIYKIPSGEITNLPYLRKIACLGKPIIISTGMATLSEIEFVLDVFLKSGLEKEKITILHCNTEYPTPYGDVNLKAMNTIKEAFKINVGYSDHTLGIQIPIAAVALGATVIEKHFTLDNSMEGPDHKASLEPQELREMVRSIRIIERALGNGEKAPSKSEQKNIEIARKSIVTADLIKKGELFSEDNLTTKRPGNGVSPIFWDKVIGKKSNRDYTKDELIDINI
jgi:N,N'-diacetyllegionaminate synthase